MLGQLLDRRYKIIEPLGSGSFGQTYIAIDVKLFNAKCVIKQLKLQPKGTKAINLARRFFDLEAQILHRLGTHDQIPQLLAHFQENRRFYLVQQFIEGHLLSQELTTRKRFTEDDVINLLEDILQPLVFVHENNVIHRDIKPCNLIRRKSDGKIVLIDFGAIKQIETTVANSEGSTNMTVIVGTPGYMPSEQASGHPKLSSDIYAVGMIGIQALTGLRPAILNKDEHSAEVIWRNLVQVSPRLADVLDKMICYDFRQRYESALEALQALKQLRNPEALIFLPNINRCVKYEQIVSSKPVAPTREQQEALDNSLLALLPVDEQQRVNVPQTQIRPQKPVPLDQDTSDDSTLLSPSSNNSLLLLGLSFGIITSLAVAVLIYVFFQTKTNVPQQPASPPSQNSLSLSETVTNKP
jgi:serine/threonine protein kinase